MWSEYPEWDHLGRFATQVSFPLNRELRYKYGKAGGKNGIYQCILQPNDFSTLAQVYQSKYI